MQQLRLDKEIQVFGFPVKSFPEGIDQAFETLIQKVPGGFSRSFFGICQMTDQGLVYYVAAEERDPGEADRLKLERLIVEKATYAVKKIEDWRTKTQTINNVFHELLKGEKVNKNKPSVEWYKNEHEMLCMIQLN